MALIAALSISLSLAGCGDRRVINGTEYDTYGFISQSEKQNPNIQYELIFGNLVWGIILCETIVAPIYFFGFSIYEPVGEKTGIVEEVVKGATE